MATNEEPDMSTMHRLLPNAFGYLRRTNLISPQIPSRAANVQPRGATDRLTCAPWTGLYFEDPELD